MLPGYARLRPLDLAPTLNKIGTCGLRFGVSPCLTADGRARLARLVWSAKAPLTLTSLHRPFGVGPILSFIAFFLSSFLLGKNAIHLGADNTGGNVL